MPEAEAVAACHAVGRAPMHGTDRAMPIWRFALVRLPQPDAAFLIVRLRDRLVVGACGLQVATPGHTAEIGYEVFADCRRQGAATEAVLGLLQEAISRGCRRVVADVGAENLASTRVVRKLGFVEAGRWVNGPQGAVVRWTALLGG